MKTVKGKRVLVTGAGGFIGSHLVEELLKEGAKVRALIHYNSRGSWGFLEGRRDKNLEVVMGDIRDPGICQRVTLDQEIVFHLAALIDIPYSYLAPSSYFETNVLGTVNLLDASLKNEVKRFINTSSSEVYGTALFSPMTEEHPLQAQSPYAASKVGAEKAALSYYMSFGLPVTVVRPFNCFGPRQSSRAVIPTIITQLLNKNSEVLKLGSLKPVRDYTFVNDTAQGFIKVALAEGAEGKVFNIGTGQGFSIEEIVKILFKLTNQRKKIVLDSQRVRPKKSEVWKLVASNKNILKKTGWKPSRSFEEGLKETLAWMEENLSSYKADIYQI
jgi:NAD dependent epimerase/dehydratase